MTDDAIIKFVMNETEEQLTRDLSYALYYGCTLAHIELRNFQKAINFNSKLFIINPKSVEALETKALI